MLIVKDSTQNRQKKSNSISKDMRWVAIIVWLLLSWCQSSKSIELAPVNIESKQEGWTYRYEWNSAYIDFILSNPLETDLYNNISDYKHPDIPRLRWPIETIPLHDYTPEDNKTLQENLDDLSTTNIGEAEINFTWDKIEGKMKF